MQKQSQQTPKRFFKLLEAGDLAFLDFIEYAIVIFGITKHGKTTYSHHLAGHALQAYKNSDSTVHYRLLLETDKKSDAKIGATMQSETEIPNKFQTELLVGQTPIYLIDNPGQKDSFGINRVLSNAYFHYRIFSKIQNMKFILLFDYPTFSGNIKETNEIFELFFKSFANFNKVKNQLLKSIAFVFSKVQKKTSLKDIYERIKHYLECIKEGNHFEEDKGEFIINLMDLCLKNQNRIQIFRKAEIGVNVEINPNLLKQINSGVEYFSRDTVASDDFQSKFYREKKSSMENVKFSQTNKVMALSQKEKQKIRTEQLFDEFSLRGMKMFTIFFQTLSQIFIYILFDSDANEMETKNKLNHTEIIRQKRRKAQRSIIENLKKADITYDKSQKYEVRRSEILKRYAQNFKNTQKAENFIQRVVLAIQFYKFCMIYIVNDRFIERDEATINQIRKDFEEILLKISKLFSGREEIQILSKFMYDINTFLNQMSLFCMIVLPHEQENQKDSKKSWQNPHLQKFLKCIFDLPDSATSMNEAILRQLVEEFKISRESAYQLEESSIMHHYLKKFHNVIIDQEDQEQKILKSLTSIELTQEHKIHCEILVFKFLRKKYYYLSQLKSFEQKKGETAQNFQSKDNIDTKNIKDIKCLIKSFIFYLKSVKKMKELSQFKQFSICKPQIYQINFSVWTYIVKLFSQLMNIKEIQKNQKQFYKDILIEIVSISRNYGLIEQVFENLLKKYEENFDQISIKSSAMIISKESEKKAKIFSSDTFKCFLDSKKNLSTEIIDMALNYANLLYDLGLKEKSLAQCYSVMKYAESSPQKIINIEDMITKIRSKNTGFRIDEEFKSVSEFEATITIKRQFRKFLKDNPQIQQLEGVNYEFLN